MFFEVFTGIGNECTLRTKMAVWKISLCLILVFARAASFAIFGGQYKMFTADAKLALIGIVVLVRCCGFVNQILSVLTGFAG